MVIINVSIAQQAVKNVTLTPNVPDVERDIEWIKIQIYANNLVIIHALIAFQKCLINVLVVLEDIF